MADLVPISLLAREVQYHSQGDETAFFEWLGRIGCVGEPRGRGVDLHIPLRRPPTDAELRELIGLFFRYRVELRQLAVFLTPDNQDWFANPEMFWNAQVFGTSSE